MVAAVFKNEKKVADQDGRGPEGLSLPASSLIWESEASLSGTRE